MKKFFYLFYFASTLYCCNPKNKRGVINSKTKKELKFSINNSTKFELKNITIGLPDTLLFFSELKQNSKTKWINIKNAYNYGFVRFYDLKKILCSAN